MEYHEAFDKATQAIEYGLIEESQRDEYIQHLLEKHTDINKGIGRETAISTDSNTNKEYQHE